MRIWKNVCLRLAEASLLLTFVTSCSTTTVPPVVESIDVDGPPLKAGSIDEVARYLAGLPGSGSGRLAGLRKSGEWSAHRARMDQLWRYYDGGRLPAIKSFRTSELGGLTSPSVLFYPFGGPDYLYAQAFFPGARSFVLVGLEDAAAMPSIDFLSDGELSNGMRGIANSLDTLLGASYFVTKDMRVDLQSTSFRGVTPLILVMMARTGHEIESIDLVDLAANGAVVSRLAGSGAAPGVHLVARAPGGGRRDVYYFQEDLSNGTMSRDKRLLDFVSGGGQVVTFVKSASYLMHTDGFSTIRSEILARSNGIVEGPSGVPFDYLTEAGWRINLYGNYTGTLDIFSEYFQPDLAAAYRGGPYPVEPIRFGVGYQANPATACLIVARR